MIVMLVAFHWACVELVGSEPGDLHALRVRRANVEDVFLLTGELRAREFVGIRAPRMNDAASIQWLAEDGATVSAGDRVAQFDSSSVQASLEERRSQVRQAGIDRESRERALSAERDQKRSAVDAAEIEVQKAQVDAAVPRELRPAVEWDKLQVALIEKEAALHKARLDIEAFALTSVADLEVLRSAEAKALRQLSAAETTLEAVSVTAPRDGIFVVMNHWRGDEGRKYQAGDTVFTGMNVATIPDLSQMEVIADLHDVDFGRVATGMSCRVILDTYPGTIIEGRVEDIVAVANQGRERAAFPVQVSLAEVDPGRMRPGMSVRVEVVRRTWSNALVVPRNAVRFEGSRALASTDSDANHPIGVEHCTSTLCVVTSGLDEGTRVVAF